MLRSFALAAAVALVAAGAASAKHAPTPAQKAGVESAFHTYLHMPSSPAAADNRILSLAISSVDPRYAAARLNSPSAGPSDMVFHRSGPGWWVVAFGSSLGCNTAPKSVLADLAVGCTPPGSSAWIDDCGPLESAPPTLVIACADANYSLGALKWRRWAPRSHPPQEPRTRTTASRTALPDISTRIPSPSPPTGSRNAAAHTSTRA